MDEQAVDQRQDDVTAFLDQIESKMGKPTIDGLVSKLKMKPPKFISILKETVVTQFDSNGHGNWSAKKKLNLLYILNKYLQDPAKRKEAHDWTEAFRHILLSVIPEMQDLRDAQHVSKLLKHWTRDSSFPSDVLAEWQHLSDHHLPLLEKNSGSANLDQSSATAPAAQPTAPSDDRRKRSSSNTESPIVEPQSEIRDQFMNAMRKFLYEAYRHFCRAAVSLNDTLHWRVVITSSFWLLNQYLLQEFYSGPIEVKTVESKKLDDPLTVCLSCIYLSGKAEQYFIRSEKLRVVAQKYMSIYFTGVSHPFLALQNSSSLDGRPSSGIPSLPGDAALFAMELKLLRLIDYDISEIANPCRTLRDWLLFKKIPPETFQKVTSMFCKEDHLSGHFNYGMDAFDHDNVLAFFMILAETKFPKEDEPNSLQGDQSDMLKESIENVFQSCAVFKELNWTSSLRDMVLTVEAKPLGEIGVQNSARFVKTFLSLWDKYYQEQCDRKAALKPAIVTPAETSLSVNPEPIPPQLELEPLKEESQTNQVPSMSSHIDDTAFPPAVLGKMFRSDSHHSNDSRNRGTFGRDFHGSRGYGRFNHHDHPSSNFARDKFRHNESSNRGGIPSEQPFSRGDPVQGNDVSSSHLDHYSQREDNQTRPNMNKDHRDSIHHRDNDRRHQNANQNANTTHYNPQGHNVFRNDRPTVYGPSAGAANQQFHRSEHQHEGRNQPDHRFHRGEGLPNRNDAHLGHMGNASFHNSGRPNSDRSNMDNNDRPNASDGPPATIGNHFSQRNDDHSRFKPQSDRQTHLDSMQHVGRPNDRPNAYGPQFKNDNRHFQRDGPHARYGPQNDQRSFRGEGHTNHSDHRPNIFDNSASHDNRSQGNGPPINHPNHHSQRDDQQTRSRSDSGHGFQRDNGRPSQSTFHQGNQGPMGQSAFRSDRPNSYGPPTTNTNYQSQRDGHHNRSRSDSGHQFRHEQHPLRNEVVPRSNFNYQDDRPHNTMPSSAQGHVSQNRPSVAFRQPAETPGRVKHGDNTPGNDRFSRGDRPFEMNNLSVYGPSVQGSAAPVSHARVSIAHEPSAHGQEKVLSPADRGEAEENVSWRGHRFGNHPAARHNCPPLRDKFCVEVKEVAVAPEGDSAPNPTPPMREIWEQMAREANQHHRVVSHAEDNGGDARPEGKFHASSPSIDALIVSSIGKRDHQGSPVEGNRLRPMGSQDKTNDEPLLEPKCPLDNEPVQYHVAVPEEPRAPKPPHELPQQVDHPAHPPENPVFPASQDPAMKLSRESSTTSVGVGKLPGFPRSLLSVAIGGLVKKSLERSFSSVVAGSSSPRPASIRATMSSIEDGEVFEDNRDANDKNQATDAQTENDDEQASKRRRTDEPTVSNYAVLSRPIQQKYAQQQQYQQQSVQRPNQQQRFYQGQQRHQQNQQQQNRNKGPQNNNPRAQQGNIPQRNMQGRQVFFNANQSNGRHHGH